MPRALLYLGGIIIVLLILNPIIGHGPPKLNLGGGYGRY